MTSQMWSQLIIGIGFVPLFPGHETRWNGTNPEFGDH